jgi:hypothetical protein
VGFVDQVFERGNGMADEWHYSIQGNRVGPVGSAELKRLAESGELSPTDLVWKEGLQNWVAASNVKGLFAKSAAPPPLPPVGVPPVATEDLKPKVEAAARATADAAKAAIKTLATSKPIAGFHIQRAAVGVSAILGALATFMPWLSAPVVGTVYGTAGDGWITLVLFVPALVFTGLGNRLSPISGWQRFAAAVPAGIAALIGISKIADINMRISKMQSDMSDSPFGAAMAKMAAVTTQTRFGLYLLVLAGIAAAAAVFLLKDKGSPSVDM